MMTNKEFASTALGKILRFDCVTKDDISIIEQALNEAELRGVVRGQEQMRERAAGLFNHMSQSNNYFTFAASQIRSLPLTEQEGTNVPLEGEVKPWCQHDDPSSCTDQCRQRGE